MDIALLISALRPIPSSLLREQQALTLRGPRARQAPGIGSALWSGRLREVLSEGWLRKHWPLLEHSTRGALAVGLLPLVWRWFGIEEFSQTAVTSYVVMLVPLTALRERRHLTIYERMAHRTLGCLLGGAIALLCVGFFGTGLGAMVLSLAAGVWIGYSIQTGREGSGYLGTQFTLGLLITLVQGPSPITDVNACSASSSAPPCCAF